jgi:hypothetical protein
MQDGGREEHRRQFAEVETGAVFLHHLIRGGETLGNGERIAMFGQLLQADGLEHIDAGQRPAVGGKGDDAPIGLPGAVRQIVILPALGVEDEGAMPPSRLERWLDVEYPFPSPRGRAEKDMLWAIIIEGLLSHHSDHYALRARQPATLDFPIRCPPCRSMHVPSPALSAGKHTESHTEEEAATHGAPNHLGMLLPPPADGHETVKQRHSRGLLCTRDVYCASRIPPSTNTMVTDAAMTSV